MIVTHDLGIVARYCQKVAIDSRNGCVATEATNPAFIEERYFLRVPPEEQQWVKQNIPTCTSTDSSGEDTRAVILNPTNGEVVNGRDVSIRFTAQLPDLIDYSLTITGPAGNANTLASGNTSVQGQVGTVTGSGGGQTVVPRKRGRGHPFPRHLQLRANSQQKKDPPKQQTNRQIARQHKAPGNPAMPFVFILTPDADGYRLHGEGTGAQDATRPAFEELSQMTEAERNALLTETKAAAAAVPAR